MRDDDDDDVMVSAMRVCFVCALMGISIGVPCRPFFVALITFVAADCRFVRQ